MGGILAKIEIDFQIYFMNILQPYVDPIHMFAVNWSNKIYTLEQDIQPFSKNHILGFCNVLYD